MTDKQKPIRDAEFSSQLVRLSSKIKHIGTTLVKIKDKIYKIKELG